MLVNKRIQDYCRGEHLCQLNPAEVLEVCLASSGSHGLTRLKTNRVETKVRSESMDYPDLMDKINC